MKYEKILETLQIIEGELDDAANQLPEYNANTDARGSIDGATLDRFTKIEYNYDTILESKLIGEDNQHVAEFLWQLRENVADKNLTRIVSTRAFIKANRHLSNGISFVEFANRFVIDWTNAEKEKCDVDGLIVKFSK